VMPTTRSANATTRWRIGRGFMMGAHSVVALLLGASVTVSPSCRPGRMGVTTQRGLSLGEVPVMRFAIPAMLLLSLAGCAEADSASLRFDADTLRLLRQDRAQCREQ
jgi:hypothetical protein